MAVGGVRSLLTLVAVVRMIVTIHASAKVVALLSAPLRLRGLGRGGVLRLLGVVRVVVGLLGVVVVVVGCSILRLVPVLGLVVPVLHLRLRHLLHLRRLALRLLLGLRLLGLGGPGRRLLRLLPVLLVLLVTAIPSICLLRLLRLVLHLVVLHLTLLLEGTECVLTNARLLLRVSRLVVPRRVLCLSLGIERRTKTATKVVSTPNAKRVPELKVQSGILLWCPLGVISDVTLSSTW